MGASPGHLLWKRCGVMEGCQESHGQIKGQTSGCWRKLGPVLYCRNNTTLRKMHFFGHITRKGGIERCIIEGIVEGKRRRGRPLTSWANYIVKLVEGSLADAVHQAVD